MNRRNFLFNAAMAGGGATTLVVNPKSREIIRDFVSLSGILNNCAGGATGQPPAANAF